MAVFRTNQEWTTYQEKQLRALESIEDILTTTSRYESKIPGEFDSIRDVLYNCTSLLVGSIDAIWNSKDIPVFPKFSDPDNVKVFKDTLESSLEDILEDMDSEDKYREPTAPPTPPDDNYKMTFLDRLGDFQDGLEEFNDAVRDIADYFSKLADRVDGYSELMNDTIKMTGATQNEAQQFRRDIIDGVSDLNADVGDLFNPQKVLSQVIAISNRTNISNRETLKEITTPLMLAQETLDADIGSLAKTFGKFYTRYSFNSADMEDLVDHMRNLSKDKDVSEDKLAENIATFETSISDLLRNQGNSIDKLPSLLEGVTNASAYLQSNYLSEEYFMGDLLSFLSTNSLEHNAMYGKYTNAEVIDALVQQGVATGDKDAFGQAMQLMVEDVANMGANLAGARNIPLDVYREASAAIFKGFTPYGEFLKSIDESTSARESAEDKHLSVAERIENKISEVGSYLATLQENVGIGFSDVASLLYIGQNLKGIIKGGLDLAGLLMKGGTLAGVLGSLGTVLGVGGAALGITALVKGIYDTIEKDEDEGIAGYDDIMSTTSEESPYGKKQVEVNNLETGESSYEWKDFESQEEADNYNASAALEADIKADYDDKPWYEKLYDIVATAIFNQGVNQMNQASMINEALGLDNPGIMDNIDSVYAEQRREINSIYTSIAEQTKGKNSESMRIFYWNNNLLDELEEAKHFLANLDTYEDYYNKGYYYSLNQGKWYSIENNEHDETAAEIPEFEVGTNYIPRDQLAYLHEGEAVVPAEYNPVGNMNELERLRQESRDKDSKDTAEIVKAILEVSEFLQNWKSSNDKKDIMNESKNSMMTPDRLRALSYQL